MRKSTRTPRTDAARHSLSYQFREIIDARRLTAYATARLAGVDPGVVSRFLTGARDIRLETADRLAAALGLRLVEVGTKGRAARRGRAVGPDGGLRDAVEGTGPDLTKIGRTTSPRERCESLSETGPDFHRDREAFLHPKNGEETVRRPH